MYQHKVPTNARFRNRSNRLFEKAQKDFEEIRHLFEGVEFLTTPQVAKILCKSCKRTNEILSGIEDIGLLIAERGTLPKRPIVKWRLV